MWLQILHFSLDSLPLGPPNAISDRNLIYYISNVLYPLLIAAYALSLP